MPVSMYKISVPVFIQLLNALDGVLDKAQVYAREVLPDHAALSQHVQSDATGGGGQPSRRGGLCTTGRPSAAHIRG